MELQTANFRDLRRERIIQVARDVFYEVGYASASMSMISARLGGSKATLYAYFDSKEALFEATIREQCTDMQALMQAHIGTEDLRTTLNYIAGELMAMVMSDRAIRTIQLVVEESSRNPSLAKMFNDVMESQGKSSMIAFLEAAHNKGQINAPNATEAAGMLKSMLFGEWHFKRILNIIPEPSPEALKARIERAVDIFMTYYGR